MTGLRSCTQTDRRGEFNSSPRPPVIDSRTRQSLPTLSSGPSRMNTMKKVMFLLLCVAFILPWTLRAHADDQHGKSGDRDEHGRSLEHHDHNVNTPVHLVGVIPVPGNPLLSTDISWTDPVTERFYLADRSNFAVDIIDAEDDVFVGRVTGMAGPNPSGGGTTTTNGPGPNGVLVTPNQNLWAGDGNSMVRIADVNPNSPSYLTITASASTSIPACDSSTAHYCGRADELADAVMVR